MIESIFAYLCVFSLFELCCKKIRLRFIIAFSLLPMFFLLVVSGLNTTSPDYGNYIQYVNESKLFELTYVNGILIEPVYSNIMAMIMFLTDSDLMAYAIVPCLTLIIIVSIVYLRSGMFFLPLLIYVSHAFLNKDMIQIRAGLVSALVLLVIHFLSEKKYLKSTLTFFASIGVHFSGAVLLIPVVVSILIPRSRLLTYIFTFVILAILASMFNLQSDLLAFLSGLKLLPTKVDLYMKWNEYNQSLGLSNPMFIKNLSLLIIFAYFFKNDLDDKFTYLSLCCFAFNVFWLAFFSDFSILAARVASVFNIFELVLISRIISEKVIRPRVLVVLVLLYPIIFFYYNMYILKLNSELNILVVQF